ncbi:MAG: hypothetical protein R3F62_13675 [Planctomycetota bacterium]
MGETALKRLALASALGFVVTVGVVGLLAWPELELINEAVCTTCALTRRTTYVQNHARDLVLPQRQRTHFEPTGFSVAYVELQGPPHVHAWRQVYDEPIRPDDPRCGGGPCSGHAERLLRLAFAYEHDPATRLVYARALLDNVYVNACWDPPRPGARPLGLRYLDLEIASNEFAATPEERKLVDEHGLRALVAARTTAR